jgi:hypothetical protein
MYKWIDKMFQHAFEKEWFDTYWAFDIHGTILIPTFRKDSYDSDFYPWAKETLQLISARNDIVLILSTSSYPEEIEHYQKVFKENNIHFKYVNENPEIDTAKGNFGYYKDKFYFNVLLEDKAGFNPETEWYQIYSLLKQYEKVEFLPDPKWSTKF